MVLTIARSQTRAMYTQYTQQDTQASHARCRDSTSVMPDVAQTSDLLPKMTTLGTQLPQTESSRWPHPSLTHCRHAIVRTDVPRSFGLGPGLRPSLGVATTTFPLTCRQTDFAQHRSESSSAVFRWFKNLMQVRPISNLKLKKSLVSCFLNSNAIAP